MYNEIIKNYFNSSRDEIGRILVSRREAKGISIEDASQIIRINEKKLKDYENGLIEIPKKYYIRFIAFYDLDLHFFDKPKKNDLDVVYSGRARGGSIKRSRLIGNVAAYSGLIAMCALWLVPLVFLVLASFGVSEDGLSGTGISATILPQHWGLASYKVLFTDSQVPFLKWFGNTFIMALATAVLSSAMTIMMSYVLSRFRFRGRKFMMNFMLILGMFPGFLTTIVLYYVLKMMGLTQNGAIGGLILVYCASSGMGYYVSKGYFDTIPKSLDEAAMVDGATKFQVFYKIMLPLAKPILIYTVLTAFMAPWGDFVFARYISFGYSDSYNVAVGLWSLLQQDKIGSYFTVFCAGGVLVSLPVTILFICLQRYYVAGVTGGAVKG